MEKKKYACQSCGEPLAAFRILERTEYYIADPESGKLRKSDEFHEVMDIEVRCENRECEYYGLNFVRDMVVSDDNYIYYRDERAEKSEHTAETWEILYNFFEYIKLYKDTRR